MEKNPTPLAMAMLVPALTEAEIKVALGEDEVTTFFFAALFALVSSPSSHSFIHAYCIVSN